MDRSTDIGSLRKLFLWLHAEQASYWPLQSHGWKESIKPVQKVQERLGTQWGPISEEELEHWLRAEDELHIDFDEKRKVLYLPPLEKNADFVPVLSLKVNIDDSRDEIRLRVMLVSQDEEQGILRGIGFRLDSPESGNVAREAREEDSGNEDEDGSEGRHDFYHAQLIWGFDWGPHIESPEWLPCSQPSFPLTANDPVTLMLSLLLTLYGKKYCGSFLQRHSKRLPVLKTAKTNLQAWIQWKEHD